MSERGRDRGREKRGMGGRSEGNEFGRGREEGGVDRGRKSEKEKVEEEGRREEAGGRRGERDYIVPLSSTPSLLDYPHRGGFIEKQRTMSVGR